MKKIPFYSNLPDGTHCWQAALKMVLTYFTGDEWGFERLERITGKLPDKWTWPTQSLMWLYLHGFDVKLIEEFDYAEFGLRGKEYLVAKWGKEVAEAQEKNSNLEREQKLASLFAIQCPLEYRIPQWQDLKNLFNEGYLMICNINACVISGQRGYSGHFVVPVALSATEIVLHDPGLPPAEALSVPKALFEKAWGYPTDKEKNLLALRLRKS